MNGFGDALSKAGIDKDSSKLKITKKHNSAVVEKPTPELSESGIKKVAPQEGIKKVATSQNASQQQQKIETSPKDRDVRTTNKGWQNLTLRLTIKSPVHIGNGDVFEPTNFVIDKDILYNFREEAFIKALPPVEIAGYMRSAESGFVALHNFIKNHSDIAKRVAFEKIKVKNGLANGYEKKIANPNAKFHIFQTSKNGEKQAYIPGSSFKGAIATAFMEHIFKTEFKSDKTKFNLVERKFDIRGEQIFKNLKVGDSRVIKSSSTIGYAVNRSRFNDLSDRGQSNIVETIDIGSVFEVDIRYNSDLININTVLQSINSHYLPIFTTVLDEFKKVSTKAFQESEKLENSQQNQYLIRVGKYSGARAVSVDGVRQIKIMQGKGQRPNIEDQETTSWLFANNTVDIKDLEPFGWILIEII